MATAVNAWIPQSHVAHIFDQLTTGLEKTCEVCHEQCAAFLWTEQRDGELPHGCQIAVCRICAGMILLIGNGL
jgi:hypothetical protein